eukprot:jgi/Tetstr1/433082/TSEL_022416.t1
MAPRSSAAAPTTSRVMRSRVAGAALPRTIRAKPTKATSWCPPRQRLQICAVAAASDAFVPYRPPEPAARSDLVGALEREAISFPPPLTVPEQLGRGLEFWRSVLPIVASYWSLQAFLSLPWNRKLEQHERDRMWQALHESGSAKLAGTICDLQGFYTKSGQLIGSRPDLFPGAYTEKLSVLHDAIPPMPGPLVRAIVEQELLGGAALESGFASFDGEPLGSASVAQVHRATLRDGRQVAVKLQRPNMKRLMMGDVGNVKALTKRLRGKFPVDYYVVFSEMEAQMEFEFDFVREAAVMDRIAEEFGRVPGGPPLVVPRSIPGLVQKRAFAMELIDGVPLSRLREEMETRGIQPGGLQAKILGRRLLRSLTDGFGYMLFHIGLFHGDPHPGNIMVTADGAVALLDYGQVKAVDRQLSDRVGAIILELAKEGGLSLDALAEAAGRLGVTFREDCPDPATAAAATAMWLFDSTAQELPGGYDPGELSPNSPVAMVSSFPQDLVFVGRSTVLIRGLSARLGIPWSLAREWAPSAAAAASGPAVTDPAVVAQWRPPRWSRWWGALLAALWLPLLRLSAAVAAGLRRLAGGRPPPPPAARSVWDEVAGAA